MGLMDKKTEDNFSVNYREKLENFIDFYTVPAFGSRSKAEIDLKVFELMMALGKFGNDYYEIARKLRITPARARNLLLNLELRIATESLADDLSGIFEYLKDCRLKDFRVEKGIISIYVPSLLRREALKYLLRKANKAWDTSFNAEILKIYIDDFIDIIPDNMKKKLMRDKRNHDLKYTVIELFKNATIGGAIGTILSKILK